MNVPKLTPPQIEAAADVFFGQHQYGLLDGESLRIEAAIDRVGYTIMPVPGLSAIAEAFIPVQGKIIFLDEAIYRADSYRHRFTLAEELAHILIHKPLFDGKTTAEVIALRESITDEQYEQMEYEAKSLAGALLMRRDPFTRDFRQLVNGKQSGPDTHRSVVRKLSFFYNVSIPAVSLRCVKLNLLTWSQYQELMEALKVE